MFLLSYVLCCSYAIVLLPYLWREYRLNEYEEIRSISSMICQFRPLGHFFLSLGNLLMFEIMTLEHKEIAWVYWCALQLVLCFDIDRHTDWHFFWLLVYIAMLSAFWGVVCTQHNFWLTASGMWGATAAFSLVWFYNMMIGWYGFNVRSKTGFKMPNLVDYNHGVITKEERWPYASVQSTVEILWVASVLVTTFFYEKMLREEKGLKSDAYGIY